MKVDTYDPQASSKYAPPGPEEVVAGLRPGTSEATVRSETLLLCTELGKAFRQPFLHVFRFVRWWSISWK